MRATCPAINVSGSDQNKPKGSRTASQRLGFEIVVPMDCKLIFKGKIEND